MDSTGSPHRLILCSLTPSVPLPGDRNIRQFGKYDPRKGGLSHESSAHKFLRKTKRNLLLAKYYPHEALWELTEQREQRVSSLTLCRVLTEEGDSQPWFRVYHWVWRKLELWRY